MDNAPEGSHRLWERNGNEGGDEKKKKQCYIADGETGALNN